MKRRTLAFAALLLLLIALVFWFGVGLPESYRNSNNIVSTSQQSYIDLQTRGVGTYFVELTQTKLASP